MSSIEQSQKIARFLIQQVVERSTPDETGSQRAQQVAILVTIWACHDESEPMTAHRLSEICGFTSRQISGIIARLLKRGLLRREKLVQPHGKGVMYALHIADLDAIDNLA